MIKKLLIPAVVVIVSLGVAMGLMATAPTLEPSSPEPTPIAVRVATISKAPVMMSVVSQGTVSPSIESQLIPEVSGRVIWMSPSLVAGGYFAEGDALLRLDDQDLIANAERAQANLTRAEAEHQHTQFEHQRLSSLSERQLASRSQIENSLRAYRIAQATETDARVAYEQALRDLERSVIIAPFDGLVRAENVDIGQFIQRGSQIATIYATDVVEVRLPIADQQLAYLDIPIDMRGQIPLAARPQVELSAHYAGTRRTWSGEIVRTEAEIDMQSRMLHVVARVLNVDQHQPLNVGLFVNAEIEGRTAENVVQLPRMLLRNGNQVLIVDNEDRLRYREVDILRLIDDQVIIGGGLEAGERVCVSPLQTVVDGMRVDPRSV